MGFFRSELHGLTIGMLFNMGVLSLLSIVLSIQDIHTQNGLTVQIDNNCVHGYRKSVYY